MGNGRGWNCICQRVYAALSRVDDRRIIGGIVHVLRSAPEYSAYDIHQSREVRATGSLQLGDHRGGVVFARDVQELRFEPRWQQNAPTPLLQDAAPCCAKRQLVLEQHPRKSTGNTSSPRTGRTASRRTLSRATRSNRGLQPLPGFTLVRPGARLEYPVGTSARIDAAPLLYAVSGVGSYPG